MTQQRTATTRLQYQVNQSSVQAAVQANKNIAASYVSLQAAAATFSPAVLALNPQLAQQATAAARVSQTNTQLAASYNQVAASATQAARAQSGGSIQSGFGTLRSLSGATGLIAGSSQAGSTVAAFAGLTAEMGLAGVGVAALAVGFRVLTAEVETQTKTLSARLDVEREGAKEIASLTTRGIQDRLKGAQQQLAIDQEVARLQTINGARYMTTIADQPLALGRALAGLDPVYNAYQDALAKNAVAIEGSEALITVYTDALNNNAGAVNKVTQEQLAFAESAVEIDRMTREQREKEIQQNLRQIEILTGLATRSDTTYDTMIALSDQIYELRNRTEDLRSVLTSTADLLADEKQFRDNAAKALQELNQQYKIEADALERAADIRQRMTDLETDTAQKSRDLALDTEEKVLDAQRDAAERRQQIEQDDGERRAEILKRFSIDYNNAVANRDALAAYKAKQTRDDELDKQAKAYRKQQDELQKALDKQLRSIQTAHERQQRSIDDAYNKQLRGLQRDLAEQNAVAENARQQQLTLQKNYNALEAQADLMHRAAQYKTLYDYGEKALVYFDNFGRRLADGFQKMFANGGYVVGGPDNGVYPGASVGGNKLNSSAFTSAYGMPDATMPVSSASSVGRRASMPTPMNISSASSKSVNNVFAPVINGANMSMRQFERLADRWYRDFNRLVGR